MSTPLRDRAATLLVGVVAVLGRPFLAGAGVLLRSIARGAWDSEVR